MFLIRLLYERKRKNMKKRNTLIIAILVAGMLVACGNQQKDSTGSADSNITQDVKNEKTETETSETRNDELYRALKHNGYPDDFCREIAYRQMNTDFTATRMLGYLYRVTSPRAEDVVDEMLAILSDRKAWIEKKQSEEAQAAISRMYREGL